MTLGRYFRSTTGKDKAAIDCDFQLWAGNAGSSHPKANMIRDDSQ